MNLLSKIRRSARQQMRQYAVPWASIPMLSATLARRWPMGQPMILVISMPRSGSTWVGETLARSSGASYLHEPFTGTLLDEGAKGGTFQFPFEAPPSCYWKVAERLQSGLPRFRLGIVRYPDQWQLSGRHERQIVVKEVNVLGLPWFLNELQPRVIHLVRHPAAVSNSRSRLPWHENLHGMFQPETIKHHEAEWIDKTEDPWIVAGAMHGLAMSLTSQLLIDYPDSMEVTYEQLCQDPMIEFKAILDFCGLPFTDEVRQYLQSSTREDVGRETNPWGTSRDSSTMHERWKRELEPDQVAQIRKGFDAMNPGFYRDDQSWSLVDQAVSP